MKKLFALKIAVLFFFVAFSQQDSIQPLYKRFPTAPPFKLLSTDSSTIFTNKDIKKNKPVFIMVFSPDCDHCQHHAEEMVNKKDQFKNIQVVMGTMQSPSKVKDFYINYQLEKLDHLIIGQDREYILGTYYKMKSLPFLAFYDKKGKLIDVFEGALPIDKVLEILNR
ncbi:MAG TPA: thioredoxin fold domain-containing protein [Chitinophagaceae bacterium]|nr:thioredoxin fold domain-containing protein [Chitinophagaceae bacterium]